MGGPLICCFSMSFILFSEIIISNLLLLKPEEGTGLGGGHAIETQFSNLQSAVLLQLVFLASRQ